MTSRRTPSDIQIHIEIWGVHYSWLRPRALRPRRDYKLSSRGIIIIIIIKLIDVSVPSDRNTLTKVIVKLSKYKDLEIKTNENMGKEDRDCVGYCW